MTMKNNIRNQLLRTPVEDIRLRKNARIKDLVDCFNTIGGFSAANLADAYNIIMEMLEDTECLILMSVTANIVATGIRGLISDLIKRKMVDVIFTTGGSIDHDIAKSYAKYYCGTFDADDEMLKEEEIHRLGNIFVPKENYGPLIEEKLHSFLDKALKIKDKWGCREILWEIGKQIPDENSILRSAYLHKVPIYVPGFYDSAFGTHILTFNEKQRLKSGKTILIDYSVDMKELSNIFFSANKLGGIIVGGGISKHHLIWWSQFKEGLDYAVYLTVAVEWDGSLSGARPREAISWNKVKPSSRRTLVYSDATITLPLICYAVYDTINENKLNLRKQNALKIINSSISIL